VRKLVAILGLALVMAAFASPASAAPSRSSQLLPGGRVTIAGGTYWWANGLTFARLVALNSPPLRAALSVIRACPRIHLYGFLSTSRGAGVVGWWPSDLRGCLEVSGGGPGSQGCVQIERTPYPDPYGLSGLSLRRTWVFIAASSDRTCTDLSTQVPGGIWARTTQPFNGLQAGSLIVIKCQGYASDGLWDFVAPYTRLPASKWGVWIPDRYVDTHIGRWDGVPSCWD
jgi:hypothetical protein